MADKIIVQDDRALLKIAQSSSPDSTFAVEFLLTKYRPLLLKLVRRFSVEYGTDFDELLQEASLAFCESVQRFDPEKGRYLSAFARKRIFGRLMNFCTAQFKHSAISLDAELDSDSNSLVDTLEDLSVVDPAQLAQIHIEAAGVIPALSILKSNALHAIKLIYWEGLSFSAAARHLGVSKQRVHAMVKKSIGLLQEELAIAA